MKEVLVKDLKVGDLIYYSNRYWEVISIILTGIKAKCYMAPTYAVIDTIGTTHYIGSSTKVILLCRDGVEV